VYQFDYDYSTGWIIFFVLSYWIIHDLYYQMACRLFLKIVLRGHSTLSAVEVRDSDDDVMEKDDGISNEITLRPPLIQNPAGMLTLIFNKIYI